MNTYTSSWKEIWIFYRALHKGIDLLATCYGVCEVDRKKKETLNLRRFTFIFMSKHSTISKQWAGEKGFSCLIKFKLVPLTHNPRSIELSDSRKIREGDYPRKLSRCHRLSVNKLSRGVWTLTPPWLPCVDNPQKERERGVKSVTHNPEDEGSMSSPFTWHLKHYSTNH